MLGEGGDIRVQPRGKLHIAPDELDEAASSAAQVEHAAVFCHKPANQGLELIPARLPSRPHRAVTGAIRVLKREREQRPGGRVPSVRGAHARALWTQRYAAATFKSAMKEAMAASREASSVARRIDDGWTVARTGMSKGDGMISPRCLLTRNAGPITAWAAVAPNSTMMWGLTTEISDSSQGLHARTCWVFGFSCSRLLPRWVKRKCLTALVT